MKYQISKLTQDPSNFGLETSSGPSLMSATANPRAWLVSWRGLTVLFRNMAAWPLPQRSGHRRRAEARSNSAPARKVPQAFRISRFSEPQVKRPFNLRERARTLHLAAPPLISKRPYVITVVRVFAVPSGPCGAAVSEAPLGLSPSSSPRGCAYCELFATPHAISHSALPDPDSGGGTNDRWLMIEISDLSYSRKYSKIRHDE